MAFSGQVDSCFAGMQFLVVQYSLPGGSSVANPLLALVFDDVAYNLTSCGYDGVLGQT